MRMLKMSNDGEELGVESESGLMSGGMIINILNTSLLMRLLERSYFASE